VRLVGHGHLEESGMKILFVCMGNICRSPTAEGVVRQLLAERAADLQVQLDSAEGVVRQLLAERAADLQVQLDSAGTHAYHVGEPPDARAIEAASRRGIDLSGLRARRVRREDFEHFDLILAMDRDNLSRLQELQPDRSSAQLRLMLEFSPDSALEEVPDPYYGGAAGFEQVLDLLEDAAEGLLQALRSNPRAPLR
jgi:protein-tyrosine phosphatase